MGSMSSKSDGHVWILDSGPGGRWFGVYGTQELANDALSWHIMGGQGTFRVTRHDVIREVTIEEEK